MSDEQATSDPEQSCPRPYFQFVDDPTQFRDPGALVVRVPRKARGKEKLLGTLAVPLKFPKYFGWNWDALDEVLGDLTWLKPVRRVVIVHEGLPFSPREPQLKTYLSCLVDAQTMRRAKPDELQLEVVFPAAAREAVTNA